MINVNKNADFTYIDSLDNPCQFGAIDAKGKIQKPKYFMDIHSHSHNFETSSILILIVTIGKFIEIFSKMKTINKL